MSNRIITRNAATADCSPPVSKLAPLATRELSRSHQVARSTVGARIILFAMLAVYGFLLHWCYREISNEIFEYAGYLYTPPKLLPFAIHCLLAFIPAIRLPLGIHRPSQMACWLLYLQVYVPALLVPLFMMPDRTNDTLIFGLCFCGAFLVLLWICSRPLQEIQRPTVGNGIFWLAVTGAFGFSTLSLGMVFGFHIHWMDLAQVYEIRNQYSEQLSVLGRGVAYLLEWQAAVINPLLIIYGLSRRRIVPLAAGLVAQLMIASTTGLKLTLFSPLVLVLIFLSMKARPRRVGLLFVVGTVLLFVLSIVEFKLADSFYLYAYLPHRLMVTPGQLTSCYLDFFLDNPLLYLRQTQLSAVLGSGPYDRRASQLISEYYLSTPEGNANVHLWSDGFSNFGYPGIFLVSIILGGILLLYDRLSIGRDKMLMSMLLVMPAMILSNASIQTTTVTHGLGLLFVVVWFMPRTTARETEILRDTR